MNRSEPCEMCGEKRIYHHQPGEVQDENACLGFCPGDACPYCTGADCIRHGKELCECDSVDRHEWDIDDPPSEVAVLDQPTWPPLVKAAGVLVGLSMAGWSLVALFQDDIDKYAAPVKLPSIRAPLLAVEKRVRYDDLCVINETVFVYYGGSRQWAGRSFTPLSSTPRDLWPCNTTPYGEVENPGQYSNYHDSTVKLEGGTTFGGVTWTDAEDHPLHYVGYLAGNIYTEDLQFNLGLNDEEIIR